MPSAKPAILPLALALLTGCATSPIKQHMREANAMLEQAESHAAARDFSTAGVAARQMRQGVRLGVESAPTAKSPASGAAIDLAPLLAAWEIGPYRELQAALAAGSAERTAPAFAATKAQCANCHAVAGRSSIRIHGLP